MLENLRIILVNTSHPGNIGSVARAMKTMGLANLYLVSPKLFPDPKATELASGAIDVLEKAVVVQTLDEAISDCHLVVGTSARSRAIPWPLLTPRECAATVVSQSSQNIAMIFGREQSGLTNEELRLCHYHVHIPSNPDYNSLNIAAAVQILCYELRVAHEKNPEKVTWDCEYASSDEIENFYNHLEEVLIEINFLNPKAPRQLMTRLRRLFNRTRLDVMEVNILRGILTAIKQELP